jgi:hypothetical protein
VLNDITSKVTGSVSFVLDIFPFSVLAADCLDIADII